MRSCDNCISLLTLILSTFALAYTTNSALAVFGLFGSLDNLYLIGFSFFCRLIIAVACSSCPLSLIIGFSILELDLILMDGSILDLLK